VEFEDEEFQAVQSNKSVCIYKESDQAYAADSSPSKNEKQQRFGTPFASYYLKNKKQSQMFKTSDINKSSDQKENSSQFKLYS